MTMRKDDDVARRERDRHAVFEVDDRVAVDEEVIEDQVFRIGADLRRHEPAFGRRESPWRRKRCVEEQRPVQFHSAQDFRERIHASALPGRTFGQEMATLRHGPSA
jgi:hypothetical protein